MTRSRASARHQRSDSPARAASPEVGSSRYREQAGAAMLGEESIVLLRAEIAAVRRRVETLEAILSMDRAAVVGELHPLVGAMKKIARDGTRIPVDTLESLARRLETFDERHWFDVILEVREAAPWVDFLRVLMAHRGVESAARDRAEHHLRAVAQNILVIQGFAGVALEEFLGRGDIAEESALSVAEAATC